MRYNCALNFHQIKSWYYLKIINFELMPICVHYKNVIKNYFEIIISNII